MDMNPIRPRGSELTIAYDFVTGLALDMARSKSQNYFIFEKVRKGDTHAANPTPHASFSSAGS